MDKIRIMLILMGMTLQQGVNGQTTAPGFAVDTTITGFHYATNFSGTIVYTKHGPSDIDGHSQPTAFSVTLTRTATFEQAKKEVLQMFRMSALSGYTITGDAEKDTIVNGHPAYLIWYTEAKANKGYQNVVFNAVVKGDGAVLVFTSGDLDKGKYVDLFKRTFYTLTF
jgi:hypothetical protein